MDPEIQKPIDELLHHLEEHPNLDPEDRDRLRLAIEEIQHSLDRYDVSSAGLAERLHESTQKFKDHHPQLTQTAGQFADMLSQMGI